MSAQVGRSGFMSAVEMQVIFGHEMMARQQQSVVRMAEKETILFVAETTMAGIGMAQVKVLEEELGIYSQCSIHSPQCSTH